MAIVAVFVPSESGVKRIVIEEVPVEAIVAEGRALTEKLPALVDESGITVTPARSINRSSIPVFTMVNTISQ
jgi:hypothetical protein